MLASTPPLGVEDVGVGHHRRDLRLARDGRLLGRRGRRGGGDWGQGDGRGKGGGRREDGGARRPAAIGGGATGGAREEAGVRTGAGGGSMARGGQRRLGAGQGRRRATNLIFPRARATDK